MFFKRGLIFMSFCFMGGGGGGTSRYELQNCWRFAYCNGRYSKRIQSAKKEK